MAGEKVVIVGAGGIAGAWLPPLKKEEVVVAAVVDLRLEQAQKRIQEFELGAEASTSLAGMIKKHRPDFVLDLTVPEGHCGVTCKALKAGCHVLGEKPMAASMAQARRMVACAEATGRTYVVSQSRRYEPRHETIQKTVAAGKLGRVTTVNCGFYIGAHFGGFRDEMPSPLILDMAIHHFDMARYMTGCDPVAVYAREFNPAGSWYKGDVAATCVFEMTGNVVFTYTGSWCAEGCQTSWQGNWRIIGDKGTLLYENDQDPRGQVTAGGEGFSRKLEDLAVEKSDMQYKGFHGSLREMLGFLRGGPKPRTVCQDNIKSLAMVFAAIESSRKRRRVPLRAM